MALPVISAVISAGSLGYGISEGERNRQQQKRALSKQKQAQRDVQSKASADAAQAERENKAAARKNPDLGNILTDAQLLAAQGNTSLTGAGGVDPQRLKLSRATLLGG